MSLEHVVAVWKYSRQSGSGLLVLLAVASHSDHRGEWTTDQATLQKCTRLGRRRVQQILDKLVTAGELVVVPGNGRGHRSTFRLTLGEKSATDCALRPHRKSEARCTLSAGKNEAECALSAPPLAPPSPPFPPDPLYPLIPLTPLEQQKQRETFGLRPLPGPQSAVFRVNLLLEEAGVPLPNPAQIGLWSKTLGGIEPLLDLLGRLVQAGLANKRQPSAYVHRAVMEQGAQPTRPEPGRILDVRTGRELLRAAGSDEIRWQQALEIIATTEES